MSTPASTPISNVSDTARWVAMYRAMESERPDALFHDPYARRLAGTTGEQILASMPQGRRWAWPMVVRTAVMDEVIMRLVTRQGVDTVLNLAAGLDARAYRLDLPRDLHWIDVDLEGILSYKEAALAGEQPRCRVEFVRADLTNQTARRSLFQRVGAQAKRALVIAEGLLVYLKPDDVTALAQDLSAQVAFRWWLIDLGSPALQQFLSRTWGNQLRAGNAPMLFFPEEGTAFFAPAGWGEAEYRAIFEEALRLQRAPRMAWVWRLLALFASKKRREQFKRFSGVVLLENRKGR
ncbi:MAG TPA: class I SAM-dependent methyltransferase [Gemmatimonadales bacterium]|nr:class I SAM-dependent methyltransferase [Gemmatimonadales bacterium]